MNQSVVTQPTLVDIRNEVVSLIADSKTIILKSIPNNYLKLNTTEMSEATLHVTSFFQSFSQSLEQASTSSEFINSIDKHSWWAYYDGVIFHGPSSNRKVNTYLSELLGVVLYLRFAALINKCKIGVVEEIFRNSDFENAWILTDDDLLAAAAHFHQFPSIDLIPRLAKIKRSIKTSSQLGSYLFFDIGRQRMFKIDRKRLVITDWVKVQIDLLVPNLRLANRGQKEKLRMYFLNLIERKLVYVDDVDKLIETRFYIVPQDATFYVVPPKSPSPNQIIVEPAHDVVASEVIFGIYNELQALSSYNTKRDIQKWIFNLFLDYDGDGFSFHNVKKATEP